MPDFKYFSDAILEISKYKFFKLFNPQIAGVEVTQAIQYYKASQHLTDSADRGPDNSLRLVAAKPAWVRVYLSSNLLQSVPNVSGELMLERAGGPFNLMYDEVATLTPQTPGTATAFSIVNYVTQRSTLGATLNFIIPADEMWGKLRLTARIWQGSSSSDPDDTHTTTIDVTLLQTLRLRGIFISYNGPNAAGTTNLNLAAPTLQDMQNTAAYTLTVDPVESQGSFASAGTLAWSTPLTGVATNPGGCSTQWISLNAAVAQVKANDGNRNDVIYYGLLPNGIPIANVGGCESSGVSTGPNAAQGTMAHEVGHGAGLGHGPCGTPGDANFPAYEPYDTPAAKIASLGEYGFNINNGTILSPATNDDYMSYCNGQWISIYHHNRLINNPKFAPTTVGVFKWKEPELVDPWLWPWEYLTPEEPEWGPRWDWNMLKAEPVISIIGLTNVKGELEIQSVMRVTAHPQVDRSVRTDMVAALFDAEDRPIAEAPVMRLVSHGCGKRGGCGCGCEDDGGGGDQTGAEDKGPFVFQALIPNVAPGASLRIYRPGGEDEETVWERRASDSEPRIGHFEVVIREESGYANWRAEAAKGADLQFSLQFSKDEGHSWNGLMVGVTDNEVRFDTSTLPSGEVIFRLLAHDGFFSTEAVSGSVSLPSRAPVTSILHPAKGGRIAASQTMRLWGAVSTGSGRRINPESCLWLVDGEEVARGLDTWITAPEEGEHRASLIVEEDGVRSQADVFFVTLDPYRSDRPDQGPRSAS